MQHLYTVVLSVITVVVAVAEASSIGRRRGDNDDNADVSDQVNVRRRMQQSNQHSVPVWYFAAHILCRRDEWSYFYNALLEQYDCMTERLVEDLVTSLCTNKGELLYKFVSDLFDANEDGYINEYEKYQFQYLYSDF